jgi:hypothetical protein
MQTLMMLLAAQASIVPSVELTPFLKACLEAGGQAGITPASTATQARQVYEAETPATVTVNFWSDALGSMNMIRYLRAGDTQVRTRPVANGDSYTVVAKSVWYETPALAVPIQICTRVR